MTFRSTPDTSVLILGAGLAGLSAAYHIQNKPVLIIEREKEVGGTARSFKIKGFTFDFTGHLLHLHTPYTKNLIRNLLKNRFYSCIRKARIYSHGCFTPYPFQASTYGLPARIVDECVLGVLEANLRNQTRPPKPAKNFYEWCLRTFGSGISTHFMIPYNEKLYQIPAANMTTEWCGPFVPTPKLEEVIHGALTEQDKDFGYNTTFLYPKHGGIQSLAKALSQGMKNIRLETTLKRIDWEQKKAHLSSGEKITYQHLINTIPLPELLELMRPLPESIDKDRKKLRFASILCLNLGVGRSRISDASWIYFPEKKFPFYRVGFPMNFTPHAVPRRCSSMYVEIPMDRTKNLSKKQILKQVRNGLIEAKILRHNDSLPVAQFLPIRYAYVIYDHDRKKILPRLFSFLSKNNIQSIGRYGAWKYSFMEEAILDGKKAADRLEGKRA